MAGTGPGLPGRRVKAYPRAGRPARLSVGDRRSGPVPARRIAGQGFELAQLARGSRGRPGPAGDEPSLGGLAEQPAGHRIGRPAAGQRVGCGPDPGVVGVHGERGGRHPCREPALCARHLAEVQARPAEPYRYRQLQVPVLPQPRDIGGQQLRVRDRAGGPGGQLPGVRDRAGGPGGQLPGVCDRAGRPGGQQLGVRDRAGGPGSQLPGVCDRAGRPGDRRPGLRAGERDACVMRCHQTRPPIRPRYLRYPSLPQSAPPQPQHGVPRKVN